MSRIVVGIDDSEPAKVALRWAIDQARATGAELTVVTALDVLRPDGRMSAVDWSRLLDGRVQAAQLWLQDTVYAVLEERGAGSDLRMQTRVAEGHPVQILSDESADADLLVVAARGAGGLRRLLLGSVSNGVVQHALCPVVVVRPVRTRSERSSPGDEIGSRS